MQQGGNHDAQTRQTTEAARSQYWMMTVMVSFTCFGLWLLSAVGT